MLITKIELKNFKRFSDLLIGNIPVNSKLVLLIGANGSGKSCVFDALGFIDAAIKNDVPQGDSFWAYFTKNTAESVSASITFHNNTSLKVSREDFHVINYKSYAFYGRTSFRQIPRLTRTSLGQGGSVDIDKDTDRPHYFIDRDNRFENDIEKITEIILKEFFRSKESNEQIRKKYIDPVNKALENIFGNNNVTKLELVEIIPPLEGKIAQVSFRKGQSEMHYNFLSAGEKEVVNLLFNLLSRGSLYKDTIYYLDEIDLHLNTKLQFNLLKEITENWIPDNCQLWTASHSLGFIEYAKKSEIASIIDFDNYDFDQPKKLYPEPKDKHEVYEIAVGKEFLPSLFQDKEIFFVENKDRDYYAAVGIENTIFVSANDRNSVYHKVKSTNFKGIVDRDFLTDEDIQLIKSTYPTLKVLKYYSIENYLYHPENLYDYFQVRQLPFSREEYQTQLMQTKDLEKEAITPAISLFRTGYPYFGEPEFNGKPSQNRFRNKNENIQCSKSIVKDLNSNDFETFYKFLPMKSYCTQLPHRQNMAKSDLAKTSWFRSQIIELLKM